MTFTLNAFTHHRPSINGFKMLRTRVIPSLLMSERRLIKTVAFKKRVYLGDPINTVRIFNDKEVDELVLLDIDATTAGREPDYDYLENIASQCFMPLAYGGGITTADQVRRLLNLGIEKVVLNSAAVHDPELVSRAADIAGSQSVAVSLDVKTGFFGRRELRTHGGTKKTAIPLIEGVMRAVSAGAGEILLTSIDRDGSMKGYDIELIRDVAKAVDVPLIACGGAGSVNDFAKAIAAGASAVEPRRFSRRPFRLSLT